jgi:hypothetical protein
MAIDSRNVKDTDLNGVKLRFFSSPAPSELAINAVAPVLMPNPMARMTKNTGNDNDNAAMASVDIRPLK